MQVLGTVKNAGLVIFCVIFLGEEVTSLQGLGYSIALAGFTWYQLVKMSGRPPAKELPGSKQELRTSDADVQLGGIGVLERLLDRVGSNDQLRGKGEA